MRVTHVITRLIVGGAQENTITSVLGLRKKPKVVVHLLSGPTNGPEGSLERELAPYPGLLQKIPSLVRPIHPIKDLLAWRQLERQFQHLRPDLVHTHSGKAGLLGRLAAHRAKVPLILHTIHGPSFGEFQGPLPNHLFQTAERIAGRVTTHFVSVAQAMTDQYLAAGIGHPPQYTRIFSGFDLAPYVRAKPNPALRQRLGIQDTDVVVGKIARLFTLKGHEDLINAAPTLIARCPRLKFLLVGDGAWRQRLEQSVAQRGLARHFIFTGLIPPAEIPRHLALMNLLVHLSRREGLPRALPQALAVGCPVVAYDCDGAREVCLDGHTGYLVPPGDQEILIRSILALAENPTHRRELGLHGQEFVCRSFSAQGMVDQLYQLYQELAASTVGRHPA